MFNRLNRFSLALPASSSRKLGTSCLSAWRSRTQSRSSCWGDPCERPRATIRPPSCPCNRTLWLRCAVAFDCRPRAHWHLRCVAGAGPPCPRYSTCRPSAGASSQTLSAHSYLRCIGWGALPPPIGSRRLPCAVPCTCPCLWRGHMRDCSPESSSPSLNLPSLQRGELSGHRRL